MPDRIIRDELLESDRWLELKRNTDRLAFMVLLLKADALGNYEAGLPRLARIWSCLGGCDKEQAALTLTALADADLIRLYEVGPKRYLHIPRWRQRLRSLTRVFPLSQWTTNEQKQALEKNMSDTSRTTVRHLSPRVARARREGKGSEGKRSDKKSTSQSPPVDKSPGKPWTDHWKAQGKALGIEPNPGEKTHAYCLRVIERVKTT